MKSQQSPTSHHSSSASRPSSSRYHLQNINYLRGSGVDEVKTFICSRKIAEDEDDSKLAFDSLQVRITQANEIYDVLSLDGSLLTFRSNMF